MNTHESSTIRMKDYTDPREQAVVCGDYPEPPLRLIVSHEPRMAEAENDASVSRALDAQRRERNEVIAANLAVSAHDLFHTMALDAVEACRLADHMHPQIPLEDRRDAQSVAVRVQDATWDAVTRYAAADVVLVLLRKLLSRKGLSAVFTDAELRAEADRIAALAHRARVRLWTGQDRPSDTAWCKAQLGFLSLTEDR